MGLFDRVQQIVRTITSPRERTVSGVQVRVPTSEEPQISRPSRPSEPSEIHTPIPGSRQARALEKKKADEQMARYKNRAPAAYQELYTEAEHMIKELETIAASLPEDQKSYLEGYRNEFNSLVKNHYLNITHDMEQFKKNEALLETLANAQRETTANITRLEKKDPSPEDKHDSAEILALGVRYGFPLQLDPGATFMGKHKLAVLEQLHKHLQASHQQSIKLNMLLLKARTEVQEDGLMQGILKTMRQRQANTQKDIMRLTEENQHILKSRAFIQDALNRFHNEVSRFRDHVAERTSLPPDAA